MDPLKSKTDHVNPNVMFEGDEFPTKGDGDPNCTHCKGSGVVPHAIEGFPQSVRTCRCRMAAEVLENVNRGWKGLSKADKIAVSQLTGLETVNTWVTGELQAFKAHLRHVAVRMGPKFDFRVVTDVDLLDAWLAKLDPFDPDVQELRKSGESSGISLTYLVSLPQLLIIRVGVKRARNSAAPECLTEALNIREQIGLPTWIVDSPNYPLDAKHISYDDDVGSIIYRWKRIKLGEKIEPLHRAGPPDLPPLKRFINLDLQEEPEPQPVWQERKEKRVEADVSGLDLTTNPWDKKKKKGKKF